MRHCLLGIFLLSLTLLTSASFAQSSAWICSKGRESLRVETPNGATFRVVNDLVSGRNYSAETEEIASDRMDYKTIDFVLSVQTLGIASASCPNGKSAILTRQRSQYSQRSQRPVTLCCEDEVSFQLPDPSSPIQ